MKLYNNTYNLGTVKGNKRIFVSSVETRHLWNMAAQNRGGCAVLA